MKLRITFLALSALLLISSLASAASLSTSADPASANLAAIFAVPASPDGAVAQLPSFEPAPTPQAGIACGSCSAPQCLGQHTGAFCYTRAGKSYSCQLAYSICAPTDCECWNGPLP